jgi:hypothetical protein
MKHRYGQAFTTCSKGEFLRHHFLFVPLKSNDRFAVGKLVGCTHDIDPNSLNDLKFTKIINSEYVGCLLSSEKPMYFTIHSGCRYIIPKREKSTNVVLYGNFHVEFPYAGDCVFLDYNDTNNSVHTKPSNELFDNELGLFIS